MGLDALDLTFRLEAKLGVRIRADDWQEIATGRDLRVGDLFRSLKKNLAVGQLGCLHGVNLFLDIRSRVRRVLSNDDLQIRSESSIAETVPHYQRQALWAELQRDGLGRLPSLERPPWVRYPLGEIILAIICSGLAAAIANPVASPLVAGAVGLAIGVCLALTKPFQVVPPGDAKTFGQVAALFVPLGMSFSDEQIEEILRQAIVESLGCEADEVTLDAWLIKDLGMA